MRDYPLRRRYSDTAHFTFVARDRDGHVLGNTQLAAPVTPDIPRHELRPTHGGARWSPTELVFDDGSRISVWELPILARNIDYLHPRVNAAASDPALAGRGSHYTALIAPAGQPVWPPPDITDGTTSMRLVVRRFERDTPALYDRPLSMTLSRTRRTACSYLADDAVDVSVGARTVRRPRDPAPTPVPPMPSEGTITGIDCRCSDATATNVNVRIRACIDDDASPFYRGAGAGASCGFAAGALARASGYRTSCTFFRFNGRDGDACTWSADRFEFDGR